MTAFKLMALACGCLLLLSMARGRATEKKVTGFLDRVYKDADEKEAKYVLFVPEDYKGDKPYPLILFLHGAGETGTDGKKPSQVGIGPAIKKQQQTFPCSTIFPQSQKRTWSADSDDGKRALAILAEVEKEYKIDPKRVYLTGLSMGGFGTWSLAAKYPDRWAAIVPICGGDALRGGVDLKRAAKIKDIPCWVFHGDADPAVPVQKSRDMVEALKAAGGHPKYDEYPGVGHNSWDKAYGTPELYEWLLKQHLK
jgi:predicted peptidase